jgi:pimeloyl-ACP methyl ester carboxylesterase
MLETTVTKAARSGKLETLVLPAADGGSIHCISAGSGPTVVLAHGFLLDVTAYQPIFDQLVQRGYRVVAFDQRGHGRSRDGSAGSSPAAAVSDYHVVLEHFGSAREEGATLVGHSMGGFLGLLFCLQYPEQMRGLKRLVLLGANAGAVAHGSLSNKLQMPLLEAGILPKLWRVPGLGHSLMKPLFGQNMQPEWLEATRQMLIRQDIQRTLPLMRAMNHENYYDKLSAITVETRVVCGQLDRTCPSWHSERLAKELPNARGRWLPGIGHMLGFEAPDAIINAITEP